MPGAASAMRLRPRQRAADESAVALVAELEAQLTKNHREIAAVTRKNIEAGIDHDLVVDPVQPMSAADAEKFNGEQAYLFLESCKTYYPCVENWEKILKLLERNGVKLASAATLKSAYEKLDAAGMLLHRPAQPTAARPAPVPAAPAKPVIAEPAPKGIEGFDLDTGKVRTYSEFEVSRMSGDTYRRAIFAFNKRRPTLREQWGR